MSTRMSSDPIITPDRGDARTSVSLTLFGFANSEIEFCASWPAMRGSAHSRPLDLQRSVPGPYLPLSFACNALLTVAPEQSPYSAL